MATITTNNNKLSGSKYTYTVSYPNKITIAPSDLGKTFSSVFKPTVTRNKTGEAFTRYIEYAYPQGGVTYKAVFTKSGSTATVSVYSTVGFTLGDFINSDNPASSTANSIGGDMAIKTSASSNAFDGGTLPGQVVLSGFNPKSISISATVNQSAPDPVYFGYIKGYATVSWSADVTLNNLRWGYTSSRTRYITPPTTLTLSANGASSSSGEGVTARSTSLAAKVINATSLTSTAKATNKIGGSTIRTATVTVQDYSKPAVTDLIMTRTGSDDAPDVNISYKWSVAAVNKSNTKSSSCTRGTITTTWTVRDSDGNRVASSTKEIVSDGSAMSATTGTDTITSSITNDYPNGYSSDKSYTVSVTVTDRIGGTSATTTYTMPTEFATLDILAGGKGIAFGAVAEHANEVTFHVADNLSSSFGETSMTPVIRNTSTATTNNETMYRALREDTGVNVGFGVGGGGTRHGIWSNPLSKWMIMSTGSGVFVPINGSDAYANVGSFPVGSCYTTSTNTNPGSLLGFGSWTLIHKRLKYQWISSGFTWDTTYTTNGAFVAILKGETIEFRFTWLNKVNLSDDTITIGSINIRDIGLTALHGVFAVAQCDYFGAVGDAYFSDTGVLQIRDWVTRSTSYPTGTGRDCQLHFVINTQDVTQILDSFCDEFVWKRTA